MENLLPKSVIDQNTTIDMIEKTAGIEKFSEILIIQ